MFGTLLAAGLLVLAFGRRLSTPLTTRDGEVGLNTVGRCSDTPLTNREGEVGHITVDLGLSTPLTNGEAGDQTVERGLITPLTIRYGDRGDDYATGYGLGASTSRTLGILPYTATSTPYPAAPSQPAP